MPTKPNIEIYIEKGSKRVFAEAIEWPGWCRSGRDQETALQSLIDYAHRYALAVTSAQPKFKAPKGISSFQVVEVLKGNSTTDFGTPNLAPSFDSSPLDETELERLVGLLQCCWKTFDTTAKAVASKKLATGPRGGGRDLARMRKHVLEGDASYLTQVGGRFKPETMDVAAEMRRMRRIFVEALSARTRGELPDVGPRGGKRCSARYAIRRSAWHILDHAWELEDRST